MIRYSLQHMQFLEQQIIQLDKDIAQKIGESGLGTEWKLLQSVPGVQANSAATILAETGTAMQQFGDEKHFSSWAGVCPGNNRSAGKEKSSHTTGGDPWLRSALTECAWAAANLKTSFLKEKFWRVATKHGGKKAPAVVAVAHTLAHIIYAVLATGQPYHEKRAPALTLSQKERIIRHHVRRLGKLGVSVYAPQPAPRRRHQSAGSTPAPE